MNTESALKLLFELRATLDRVAVYDLSLHEALAQDVERAIALADQCISELADEDTPQDVADDEDEEQDNK